VVSASVSRSDISEREFVDPLLQYVQHIRFLPIPQHIGNMSFEFPFTFEPEGG
jgi:hypothetical protein